MRTVTCCRGPAPKQVLVTSPLAEITEVSRLLPIFRFPAPRGVWSHLRRHLPSSGPSALAQAAGRWGLRAARLWGSPPGPGPWAGRDLNCGPQTSSRTCCKQAPRRRTGWAGRPRKFSLENKEQTLWSKCTGPRPRVQAQPGPGKWGPWAGSTRLCCEDGRTCALSEAKLCRCARGVPAVCPQGGVSPPPALRAPEPPRDSPAVSEVLLTHREQEINPT